MKKFINNFKHNILLYLVVSIVLMIAVGYAFKIRTDPTDEEKVGIIIGKYQSNISKSDFIKPDGIRELNLQEVEGEMFLSVVDAKDYVHNVDIFFISTSQANDITSYLVPLEEQFIIDNFGNYELLKVEDVIYGFKYNEELWIGFAEGSIHIGTLNNSVDDAAIQIVQAYLKK